VFFTIERLETDCPPEFGLPKKRGNRGTSMISIDTIGAIAGQIAGRLRGQVK